MKCGAWKITWNWEFEPYFTHTAMSTHIRGGVGHSVFKPIVIQVGTRQVLIASAGHEGTG